MALVVMNTGEEEMLKRITGKEPQGDLTLHLYDATVAISETTILTDFNEVSATGYTAGGYTLANALWTITPGEPTEALFDEVPIAVTSGIAGVYGYYITNALNDVLLWAEEFVDGPYVIPSGGGSVFVTPKIQLA
jgi:hypothetical protein